MQLAWVEFIEDQTDNMGECMCDLIVILFFSTNGPFMIA